VGFSYGQEDVVGTLVIETADEEVSSGTITRKGFFDRISAGDEVILQLQPEPATPAIVPDTRNPIQRLLQQPTTPAAAPVVSTPAADPELRALLRALR
jgi:hypothetical protein